MDDKRKFIGGAELARRNARKRRWEPKEGKYRRADQNEKSSGNRKKKGYRRECLYRSLSPLQLFFSSLLSPKVQLYLDAHHEDHVGGNNNTHYGNNNNNNNIGLTTNVYDQLISEICFKASVPIPKAITATNDNHREFYSTRKALVLEEARHILSEELAKAQKRRRWDMHLNLVDVQFQKKTDVPLLSFQKAPYYSHGEYSNNMSPNQQKPLDFTNTEKFEMKSGSVFQIRYVAKTNAARNLHQEETSILAAIVPRKSGFGADDSSTLTLMVFRKKFLENKMGTNSLWQVRPITSLLNQVRQFEACQRAVNVSFMPSILGWKDPTHIRFDESEDDDDDNVKRQSELLMAKVMERSAQYSKSKDNKDYVIDLTEPSKNNGTAANVSASMPIAIDNDDTDDASITSYCNNNGNNKQPSLANEESLLDDGLSTVFEVLTKCDSYDELIGSSDNVVLLPFSEFSIPSLNQTQERAADKFLQSKESTMTLIQGPPGTGKTTFLVSVIFMSLWFQKKYDGVLLDISKRVLVTAPTNKAITVIASRFLDLFPSDMPINVVMIGVEDKLVPDESFSEIDPSDLDDPNSMPLLSTSLKSIFVYTWIDTIVSDYLSFDEKLYIDNSLNERINNIIFNTEIIEKRLINSIPKALEDSLILKASTNFVSSLEEILESGLDGKNTNELADHLNDSKMHLKTVSEQLKQLKQSDVVRELLDTANVIFCTLSSSGSYGLKMTSQIDDLFIDEAAAATEIEVCIPFHLYPKRMLAVGDPKQLPATIMSRRATHLGFNKSLHERLMIECRKEPVMLDVQYRMKPDICQFPSNHFYYGKIMNGEIVQSKDYKGCTNVLNGQPYIFFQVSGQDSRNNFGSYYNDAEAQLVLTLVTLFKNRSNMRKLKHAWFSPDKIRIITFYQGQVQRIQSLLNNHGLGCVHVATVDSSQGCESDIVIVSFVRSNINNGGSRHKAGFLTDERRINVALTRAKYQLICIGDALGTLACSGDPTLKAIVDDAKNRSLIKNVEDEMSISSLSSSRIHRPKKES